MKRFAAGLIVLSSFACSSTAPTERAASAVAVSTDLADASEASLVPKGSFMTIAALCDAQRALAAPRIADAKQRVGADNGGTDLDIAPSCEEDENVLTSTKIALGDGITDVKAIMVEAGYSTQTFIVTRTNAGWSAIRTPILVDSHDDPGCPSIERALGILSVRIESGMVVIVNDANRYLYQDKEAGDLTLTYARACGVGAACGEAVVFAAKANMSEIEDPDAPRHMRLFATTFTLSNSGVISPAETYDDAKL